MRPDVEPGRSRLVDQLKTLAALRRGPRTAAPPDGAATWGHLRVLEPIGRGAFGTVYRAWDPRLDRDVALKLLAADVDRTVPPRSSAVIDEGRLLARVRHPNVVTIYGADRIDGRVGLWMELVTGRTLDAAWHDGRRPSARRGGAHRRRAVPRGRRRPRRRPAAPRHQGPQRHARRRRPAGADGPRRRPRPRRSRLRTRPAHRSISRPKCCPARPATVQSDVYSIGVVLFRLLTGSYPVTGRDLAALRRAHAERGSGSPAFPDRSIPRPLRAVVAGRWPSTPGAATPARQRWRPRSRGSRARRGAPGPRWPGSASPLRWCSQSPWGGSDPGRGGLAARPPQRATQRKTAIAVLPFVNLSSDPDSDDFVDGLTAEVIRDLAGLDGLQVRSQTSSFFFKDGPRDMARFANACASILSSRPTCCGSATGCGSTRSW